ncbi:hypothetical protein AtNW77_Chr1g0007961 [Arabidopsis thaliana]|jgi:hypothetical protein|uniref:Uncharacterized protein n=4 Tax=Arabidopsis TaxID=3701 RepID=A0A654E7X5_ARATH|nr:uncharacterized protein AT1G07901 [Arabidopsis thaliana]KAG7596226.1 hypothetical protein ISN44_As06g007160 [Arabidopsis suecica]KAG7645488.1 hypothetical protein ISN45_At01g007370 [Arabidopsis thaliana x Arabidopsis arenosa]AEE28209.1 hypothetical protein AT1G07901 [Arabidopsis thaliana]CAA0177259.1 unnamed protein product [Arabidopsis thaliana]VYS45356.1 unnamed protein product [Arabidopsis thaliana]|eukprot:NP_001117245.1 hypothetical protein AT1G07901 [Arabidopsis thaliana]
MVMKKLTSEITQESKAARVNEVRNKAMMGIRLPNYKHTPIPPTILFFFGP